MNIISIFYIFCALVFLGIGISSIGIARYWHEASQYRDIAFIGGRNTSHRNRNIALVIACAIGFAVCMTFAFT